MLQQTQVQTVIPYYDRFMAHYPDLSSLAAAPEDDVLTVWTGLGYYARARNLHVAARWIQQHNRGVFPADYDQICALPGIGRSTAGAILALAYHQHYPILDGNVKRVLARYHLIEGWPGRPEIEKQLWLLAEQHTPIQNVAEYTQAIMDLGATICLRRQPKCAVCPLRGDCGACRDQRQAELPTRKAIKAPRPERTLVYLIVHAPAVDSILLVRRPERGIWGGLWCLPEYTPESFFAAPRLLLPDGNTVARSECRPRARFEHQFSHFVLKAEVYSVSLAATRVADTEMLAHEHWLWYDFSIPKAIPPPLANVIKENPHHDETGFLQEARSAKPGT